MTKPAFCGILMLIIDKGGRTAMNLETLFIFSEIVETGSMTQASERLHVTQPAMTQQIKTLESQLGSRLLDRSNKGVRPTPAGELVYRAALDIKEIHRKMTGELDSLRHQRRVMHILATNLVYSYALPCTLYDIQDKFPEFTLDIGELGSAAIESKVANGQADVGFILGAPETSGVVARLMFSDRVYLTAGGADPVRESIRPRELCRHRLLMLANTHRTRQLLDRRLAELGADPSGLRIPYTLDSTESIKQSAVNGHGLAFLPYIAIKKELYNRQLRIVELEGFQLQYDYYLLKNHSLAHGEDKAARLVSYLEKTIENTIC